MNVSKEMQSEYREIDSGMHYIKAIRRVEERNDLIEKTLVGKFGISSDTDYIMNWCVTKGRDIPEPLVVPHNKYCDSLFNSMFKGWD